MINYSNNLVKLILFKKIKELMYIKKRKKLICKKKKFYLQLNYNYLKIRSLYNLFVLIIFINCSSFNFNFKYSIISNILLYKNLYAQFSLFLN